MAADGEEFGGEEDGGDAGCLVVCEGHVVGAHDVKGCEGVLGLGTGA